MQREFLVSQLRSGQSVIIYQSPSLVKPKRSARFLATFLLSFSLIGFVYLFGPMVLLEIGYRLGMIGQNDEKMIVASKPDYSRFGQLLFLDERGVIAPADKSFSLIIPKIGVNAKVLPNVDPADEEGYNQALKIGLAHAKSTALPNTDGTIYIFGHSTNALWNVARYNAIFYLLPKLEKGDEIIAVFEGRNFVYQVTEKLIAEADDVSFLNSQKGEKRLVLQTCWPPGTTLKRLILVAKPSHEEKIL